MRSTQATHTHICSKTSLVYHAWREPKPGDPALICDRCGKTLEFLLTTLETLDELAGDLIRLDGWTRASAFRDACRAAWTTANDASA